MIAILPDVPPWVSIYTLEVRKRPLSVQRRAISWGLLGASSTIFASPRFRLLRFDCTARDEASSCSGITIDMKTRISLISPRLAPSPTHLHLARLVAGGLDEAVGKSSPAFTKAISNFPYARSTNHNCSDYKTLRVSTHTFRQSAVFSSFLSALHVPNAAPPTSFAGAVQQCLSDEAESQPKVRASNKV
jgi:hypothetical protein